MPSACRGRASRSESTATRAAPSSTAAASTGAIIGPQRHPGVTFLSAVLGAAFIGLFHANMVGSTGPSFVMEATALTDRNALRAYLSGQDIVLAAIGIPLLITLTFGLGAAAGFPTFGFETMPVALAAVPAPSLVPVFIIAIGVMVVSLGLLVIIGRADGPAAGLAALPIMAGSPYGEAARGVFLAELGQNHEARRHFEKAMALARTEPERRLMEKRLSSPF